VTHYCIVSTIQSGSMVWNLKPKKIKFWQVMISHQKEKEN